MTGITGWLLALILKPIVAVLVVIPGAVIAWQLQRMQRMRPSKLKRVLLYRWDI